MVGKCKKNVGNFKSELSRSEKVWNFVHGSEKNNVIRYFDLNLTSSPSFMLPCCIIGIIRNAH